VQFNGFGALSRRPKELAGFCQFTVTSPTLHGPRSLAERSSRCLKVS
jgi:hypothetical protein